MFVADMLVTDRFRAKMLCFCVIPGSIPRTNSILESCSQDYSCSICFSKLLFSHTSGSVFLIGLYLFQVIIPCRSVFLIVSGRQKICDLGVAIRYLGYTAHVIPRPRILPGSYALPQASQSIQCLGRVHCPAPSAHAMPRSRTLPRTHSLCNAQALGYPMCLGLIAYLMPN